VMQIVCDFLKDKIRIIEAFRLNRASPSRLRGVIAHAESIAEELRMGLFERQRELLSTLIHGVTIQIDSIRLSVKRSGFAGMSAQPDVASAEASEEPFNFIVPIQLKRRGIEAKLVIQTADDRPSSPDMKLVALLADAHRWVNELAQGRAASVSELALQTNRDPSEVSRVLPLAFLAPTIVSAILEGRQPLAITPPPRKRAALALGWANQRRSLGFPHTKSV